MRFYERVLGAKIETMMTHAESPMVDQTLWQRASHSHAALKLGDQMLMASDAMAGQP
jgi:uncharacterized glyoxalase superfamily protein PhnB